MKSRAKTEKETKMEILEYIKTMRNYWIDLPSKSLKERMNGIIFSILVMFDGESDLPAMDIVIRPHEDDRDYNEKYDTNWFPDGLILEDGDLHNLWGEYRK